MQIDKPKSKTRMSKKINYQWNNDNICVNPSAYTVFKSEKVFIRIAFAYKSEDKAWIGSYSYGIGSVKSAFGLNVKDVFSNHYNSLTDFIHEYCGYALDWILFQEKEVAKYPDEVELAKQTVNEILKGKFENEDSFTNYLNSIDLSIYKDTIISEASTKIAVRANKKIKNTIISETPTEMAVRAKEKEGDTIFDHATPKVAVPAAKKIDLNNYPGAKGGSGVIQKIINQVPGGIDIIIEGCLGSGTLLRTIKPAERNVGIDINEEIINYLNVNRNKERLAHAELLVYDIEKYLRSVKGKSLDNGKTIIYLDPPYPKEARKNQRDLYAYEMPTIKHTTLLDAILQLKCKIMISTRANELYAEKLKGWRLVEFTTSDRSGTKVTEQLYMNYPEPKELHDTRFAGNNFRERERIKRKAKRNVEKFKNLPSIERQAILELMRNEKII